MGGLILRKTTLLLRAGLLQQSLFQLLLALDAVPCPRNCFQALRVNLGATRDALAKCALPDPVKSGLHHLQKLSFVVALINPFKLL